ncbi:MAG: hypothetical protein ACR2HZ_03980 [Gemmatimonadaceae bacterium]|jgi:hypothetical protein
MDTVASLSELYLGNILYALELAAMSLEEQGRAEDAKFYRGIARKLASARGQAASGTPPESAPPRP